MNAKKQPVGLFFILLFFIRFIARATATTALATIATTTRFALFFTANACYDYAYHHRYRKRYNYNIYHCFLSFALLRQAITNTVIAQSPAQITAVHAQEPIV